MDTPSDALLARYLAGECSAAETRTIEQWNSASPAHRARLDALRAIWNARTPSPVRDVEAMWQRVRRAIDAGGGSAVGRRFRWHRDSRDLRSGLAAAAAITLMLGAGVVIARTAVRGHPPAMREYATARRQRITLRLPDGTSLVLAPQSRVRIPDRFGTGARDVYLDGEALFSVVHDGRRPFRVHSRTAVVEDIGTRFDVRAYAEDSSIAVAVAEGAVALGRTEAEGLVIRAGQIGVLAPNGMAGMASEDALADYLGWADGRLHFDHVALPQVLRVIARWYDLDIRLEAGTLERRTITADFTLGAADEILRALALAAEARLTRSGQDGRIVTLSPHSPATGHQP